MELGTLFSKQSVLIIEMILGAFLKRINVVTDASKSSLVDIVLYVALPCSIVKAFQIELSTEVLITCLVMFIAALIAQFVSLGLGKLLFRKKEGTHKTIMEYGATCSNSGMLGNAVAENLFSDTGVLFASVALVPVRAFMWAVGLVAFTNTSSKKALVKKVLSHPCIVAVEIGLVIMLFQIKLPDVISSTISSIANMSTALCTISVGTILADVDFKSLITKDTIEMTLVRLGVVPLVILLGCSIFNLPDIVKGICVIFASMPVATTTAILASKYNYDERFASSCVVLTTLLSTITTPLWCMLLI